MGRNTENTIGKQLSETDFDKRLNMVDFVWTVQMLQ